MDEINEQNVPSEIIETKISSEVNNVKKRKLFASRAWYSAALIIIFWAVLQEILMASTDIVDNIFVNYLENNQVAGLADLNDYIFRINQIHAVDNGWIALNSYSAGQVAVNGVTASNQLYIIMFCMTSGFCYGAGVYSAQYFGANDISKLKQVTALKIYATIIITIIFSLFALPGITEALIGFTTNPKFITDPGAAATHKQFNEYVADWASQLSTEQGSKYYRIISISYVIFAINETAITSLRETRRPFFSFFMSVISLTTNCVMNVFLTSPKFIPGFDGFGVTGCAFATSMSRVLQLIFIIVLFSFKKFEFIPSWRSFILERILLTQVFLKTLPIFGNELLYALGQVVQVKLKAMYSFDALTANAMFETIVMAFFSPLYHGVNAGISVFVGNELGAGRFENAQYNAKHLMRLSVVIGTIFGLLLIATCWFIPDLMFSNSSQEAKHYGVYMILIFAATYPIIIINNSCYSILRTGGSVLSAFMMDSGFNWALQIPTLAILIILNKYEIIHMSFITIHFITCMFEVVKIFAAVAFYFKKRWLRNLTIVTKVTKEEKMLLKHARLEEKKLKHEQRKNSR